jgi:signal transduction histidine kinase
VTDGKEPDSVRPSSVRLSNPLDLRRSLERLSKLPVRPATARALIDTPHADAADCIDVQSPLVPPCAEIDPGWIVSTQRGVINPFEIVAESPWWKFSAAHHEALNKLWRHSVAVSLAAKRLAREANDPDPSFVGRIGLLHRLALWALAAVDPDRLVAWMDATEPGQRRALERDWFGTDARTFGRNLAQQWDCDPLLADAAWLYADTHGELASCSEFATTLAFIRQAHLLAEQTPWGLGERPLRDPGPLDPKIRLLMAEVQSRCGTEFADADVSPREERLTRENASLRRESISLRVSNVARERLIATIADHDPTQRPEVWAERAGLAFCDLPGVSTAKVVWVDSASSTEPMALDRVNDPTHSRPATSILALGTKGKTVAEVHLWGVESQPESLDALHAWSSWATLIAERARAVRRLDSISTLFQERSEQEETLRRSAKLDALGEFAAGAGHELNNPLAVILGRAQLILTRSDDPETLRSLRAIIVQAQRAHKILRDLMYVARPPEPRPRLCSAEDILKASIKDAQAEAESRGIRLVGDPRPMPSFKVFADPDPLRHIADVLVRNALEATPTGGTVSVTSSSDEHTLRWVVRDNGHGLSPHEASHLFDPFFCGRQAGRGLGLGLPRAARFIERVGGELTWQSIPNQGTSFQVKLQVDPPPPSPVASTAEKLPSASGNREDRVT